MTIIEKVIQPLLNAQRELGHAEGRIEGRTEGHTEGRTEGRIAERNAWRNWLDRKATAEAEGKAFNEPPPDERE